MLGETYAREPDAPMYEEPEQWDWHVAQGATRIALNVHDGERTLMLRLGHLRKMVKALEDAQAIVAAARRSQ